MLGKRCRCGKWATTEWHTPAGPVAACNSCEPEPYEEPLSDEAWRFELGLRLDKIEARLKKIEAARAYEEGL